MARPRGNGIALILSGMTRFYSGHGSAMHYAMQSGDIIVLGEWRLVCNKEGDL